jgi:N-acetylglucosamine-6-sulfatase
VNDAIRSSCVRARAGVMLAAALLASACGSNSGVEVPPPPKDAPQPNIIVVMTDDQTQADIRVMPRVRALIGDEGTTFVNSYVTWPLCCPSRSTAFTGQYAHNHHVLSNHKDQGGGVTAFDARETAAVWLSRLGYKSILIGKYLNGYGADTPADVPPGWGEWYATVATYLMWGYSLNENGHIVGYGQPDQEDPALYQTDVLRAKAVDAIHRNAHTGKPLYMHLAFVAPHREGGLSPEQTRNSPRPAPRHKGLYASEPLPQPASFDEADMTDKPSFMQSYAPLTADDIDSATTFYRNRLESLQSVDEAVGAIDAALAAENISDNTFLIFTSDNGVFFGEHRVPEGKNLMYDPASRVPLLIRGPGIPARAVSSELVANVDLAPTLVDMSGATPGLAMDGRSLLSYARNPGLHSARPLLFDAPAGQPPDPGAGTDEPPALGTHRPKPARPDFPPLAGLRTPRYVYVEWGTTGESELYDMDLDPDQLQSRHADTHYAAIVQALHADLSARKACVGEPCRRDLAPLPDPAP